MSYTNTGYQRATSLSITTTTVSETGTSSITDTYSLLPEFTYSSVVFPLITSVQIQQISISDYNARIAAFASYMQSTKQSLYPGITISASGSRVQNLTSCPI